MYNFNDDLNDDEFLVLVGQHENDELDTDENLFNDLNFEYTKVSKNG